MSKLSAQHTVPQTSGQKHGKVQVARSKQSERLTADKRQSEPHRLSGFPDNASQFETGGSSNDTRLPHLETLEAIFERPLRDIQVRRTQNSEKALAASKAKAATRAGVIFLPSRPVSLPILAHEVTHALQYKNGKASGHKSGPPRLASRSSSAEKEAETVEADVRRDGANARIGSPKAILSAEEVAFKRNDVTGSVKPSEDGLTPNPKFKPAAMPEIPVDLVAQKKKEERGERALSDARTSGQLAETYKSLTVTQKYNHIETFETKAGTRDTHAQNEFKKTANASRISEVETTGDDKPLPNLKPVETPKGLDKGLNGLKADAADYVDAKAHPSRSENNQAKVDDQFKDFTKFKSQNDLQSSLDEVSTQFPKQEARIAPSDNKRVDKSANGPNKTQTREKRATAKARLTSKLVDANANIAKGPGPERIKLTKLRATADKTDCCLNPKQQAALKEKEAKKKLAKPDTLKALEDPVAKSLFNLAHDESVKSRTAPGTNALKTAQEKRDGDRKAALEAGEKDRDQKVAKAIQDRRQTVIDGRQIIRDKQQEAVQKNLKHARDQNKAVEKERQVADAAIDTVANKENEQINTRVAADYSKVDGEISKKETEAKDKKKEHVEKNSGVFGWIKSKVVGFFKALVKIVDDVFNALRTFIADVFNALIKFIADAVNRAAKAIKAAIDVFAEAAKAAVNALLETHFPETAKWLTEKIDQAAKAAKKGVDKAASVLTKALTAIIKALCKALDTILAAYQGVFTHALKIMTAVVTGDFKQLGKLILEPLLKALGIKPKDFYAAFGTAGKVIGIIVSKPVMVLQNLLDAVFGGFKLFGKNLRKHLLGGIIGWLTGALASDIQPPKKWNLLGVLDLGRQILGLTLDMVRRIAVRLLGEAAVEKIEFFMEYAKELITKGWSGLFKKIMGDLTNLATTVFDAIKTFMMEKIIMSAVTWLIGLFNPAGAIAKILMTIWNLIQFLRERLGQMIEVVKTVFKFIADIAFRKLKPAQKGIEKILGNLLPIAISLLANLLGLTGVAAKVQKIMENVRKKIEDAIVKLIKATVAKFTGKGRGKKGKKAVKKKRTKVKGEDILKPKKVGKGTETHTVYIEIKGKKAVPMMRSTPVPLVSFLNKMRNPNDVKSAVENARWMRLKIAYMRRKKQDTTVLWSQDGAGTIAQNSILALTPNIDTILAKFLSDTKTELLEEEKEVQRGVDSPSSQLADQSFKPLDVILDQIFEVLRVNQGEGESVLSPFIDEAIKGAIHQELQTKVADVMTDKRYVKDFLRAKTWKQITELFIAKASGTWELNNILKTTSGGGGGVIGQNQDLRKQLAKELESYSDKNVLPSMTDQDSGGYEKTVDTPGSSDGVFDDGDKLLLGVRKATGSTGTELTAFRNALLAKKAIQQWLPSLASLTKEAIKNETSGGENSSVDQGMRDKITGETDRTKPKNVWYVLELEARHAGKSNLDYKVKQGDGFIEYKFIEMVSEADWKKRSNKRARKTKPDWKANAKHVANKIYIEHPKQHEWIQRAFVLKIFQKTVAAFTNGDGISKTDLKDRAAAGDLLLIQRELRTPTSQIIYNPNTGEDWYSPSAGNQNISKSLLDRFADGLPASPLTRPDDYVGFASELSGQETDYGLLHRAASNVDMLGLQAHSGGLNAPRIKGLTINPASGEISWTANKITKRSLSTSSSAWHKNFAEDTRETIQEGGAVDKPAIQAFVNRAAKYYKDTVWDGGNISNTPHYIENYYWPKEEGSDPVSLGHIKTQASTVMNNQIDEFSRIAGVLGLKFTRPT